MGKQLLVLIGFISMISVKCQNEAIYAPKVVRRDTTSTLAVHVNYGFRGIKYGPVNRIVADSLQWVGEDSLTMKKKWSKITYYEVVVDVQVDSAIAAQFKVPMKDSLGRPNVINLKINAEKKYVVEPIYDLDSAINYLQQYIIKDSTQKK